MKRNTGRPRVYSYLRFSTAKQEWGDSIRRQMIATEGWARRMGLPVDETLEIDKGLSGYTGDNIDNGALGQFVLRVQAGDVPVGSFLVVEAFDRLTRQQEQVATFLLLTLTLAGIRIVRLEPSELIFDSDSDLSTFFSVLCDLSRGHGESKRKSGMILKAKAGMRAAARAGVKVKQRLPRWLRWEEGAFVVREEFAAPVRRVYELAAEGHGLLTITRRMNAEGQRTLGKGAQWSRSTVYALLRDRQAEGRYQPGTGRRQAEGAPILTYYPPIVSERLAAAAQAAFAGRKQDTRRDGTIVNLFGRLIHDAGADTRPYVVLVQVLRDKSRRWQLCRDYAFQDDAPRASVLYPLFERAVLSRLSELVRADVDALQVDDEQAAREALERAEGKQRRIAVAIAADPTDTLLAAARTVDGEVTAAREALEDAERKRRLPAGDALEECQELIAGLDTADDRQAARSHVRALITHLIARMDVVIVPRGAVRLIALQVTFKGGRGREYLIAVKRDTGRKGMEPKPGYVAVKSLSRGPADDGVRRDFRKATDAASIRRYLETADVDTLVSRLVQL